MREILIRQFQILDPHLPEGAITIAACGSMPFEESELPFVVSNVVEGLEFSEPGWTNSKQSIQQQTAEIVPISAPTLKPIELVPFVPANIGKVIFAPTELVHP